MITSATVLKIATRLGFSMKIMLKSEIHRWVKQIVLLSITQQNIGKAKFQSIYLTIMLMKHRRILSTHGLLMNLGRSLRGVNGSSMTKSSIQLSIKTISNAIENHSRKDLIILLIISLHLPTINAIKKNTKIGSNIKAYAYNMVTIRTMRATTVIIRPIVVLDHLSGSIKFVRIVWAFE